MRALATLIIMLIAASAFALPGEVADQVRTPSAESSLKSSCSAAARATARPPLARDYEWDVQHTDLTLQPFFDTETLSGSVSFDCLAQTDGLAVVYLDFYDNMSVTDVTADGSAAAWTHADNQIEIPLPAPLDHGDTFSLSVDFNGAPSQEGFGSFRWESHDGWPLVCTLSEPYYARGWWPCKDVPDDKFTADIRYRIPNGFMAPGPGLLQSITDHGDGTETWHWLEQYPINTYLIALTVTYYHHYTDWYVDAEGDSLPIENYVFPEDIPDSQEDLSITAEAIGAFEELFGPYPFREEKYGHMVFHWGGAMEHQTCTSYGFYLLTGSHYYDWVVVHELAHQWWGNGVTLRDWENVWLNEGFATYSEALWFEYLSGQEGLTDWMTVIEADVFEGPVYNNPVLFGSTVYDKGGWVLHMLRWLVNNDDDFFAALRYYYSQHEYGNAHTTDLQADLENYLGMDLDDFFQQWVYGIYRPSYEWGWIAEGGPGAWQLLFKVDQVQTNTGLFTMPLPVRVQTPLGEIDLRLDNTMWSELFTVELGDAEPVGVTFDPDNWLLEYNEETAFDPTGDASPPPVAAGITGNWPNPFNPSTMITFGLDADGPARLAVYDSAGRLTAVLSDSFRRAGAHQVRWDGLDRRGNHASSGVYLLRLSAGEREFSHRLLLLK